MAHFARVENGIVCEVNVINNAVLGDTDFPESELIGQAFISSMGIAGEWKQTSYNNNIRKQYAGIGFTYDADADVFVAPRPFPSWSLDGNHDWQPPTPMPVDGEKRFVWFEPNRQWIEIVEP